MKHHIKRLKRELVYQGSILDIYADYMQLRMEKRRSGILCLTERERRQW